MNNSGKEQTDKEKVNVCIKEMLECEEKCEGIEKNLKEGIIPRGLFLEELEGPGPYNLCIIVGFIH